MSVCRFPVYQDDDPLYVSAFGIERVGENARWGPSRRNVGIVHYVLSGKGYFNGKLVCANQGFYISPASLTEYYPDEDDPWNYFWMDTSPAFAERYVFPTVRPDKDGIFNFECLGKLMLLVEKIFGEGGEMSNIESLAYAFSLLKLHAPEDTVSKSRRHVLLAKNFIENHINKAITVCDVANAISVHDRYLYSLFMRYEKTSPKEYILKRKIETAQDLLENTGLSIMEISAALGFSDVYSFSRMFKMKTGICPTEFRKTLV